MFVFSIVNDRIDTLWRLFVWPQRGFGAHDPYLVVYAGSPFGGQEIVPSIDFVDMRSFGYTSSFVGSLEGSKSVGGSEKNGLREGSTRREIDFTAVSCEVSAFGLTVAVI